MESFVKFKDLLKKLFQFEASDLDFGIYRVLNYKRDKIDKFIQQDLENKVGKAFAKHKDERLTNINQILEEIKQKIIQSLGEKVFTPNGDLKEEFKDTPLGRDYLSVKAQKEEAETIDEIKLQVFNDLYNFFSRYYEEGDFVPQYRYSIKGHKYTIPYNGEEVKLYWANQEQYYIKTGLLFRDYTFKANDHKVIFRIVTANEELASNKATKERFFVLDDESSITIEDKTIFIRFQYRELTEKGVKEYDVEGGSNTSKQEKINQKSYDEILKKIQDITLKAILSRDYKNGKPLLLYQINRFTAKNTKDYFIHKNLKKFLTEQLDYFIKSEVLDIETIEKEKFLDKHITRAKVVREIGEAIIDFLSQIEDFQKRLWEKKKFVLKTEYVITTDRVSEEFYEEIWKNEEQRKEWEDLGFEIPKTKEELKTKKLPIDTKYFSQEFKERLLEKLTENADLDDILDGLLIKSENWQALNLILNKYKEKVQTIYIDPPFNKEQDADYLYNVKYKDSTWASMLENRLRLARDLLNDKGSIFVRCDYNGNWIVRPLMDEVFGKENFRNEVIVNRFKKPSDTLATVTESFFFFVKNNNAKPLFNKVIRPRTCTFCKQPIEPRWHLMISSGEGKTPLKIGDKIFYPPRGQHWKYSQDSVYEMIKQGRIRINDGITYTDVFGNKVKGVLEYLESEEQFIDSNWTDIPGYKYAAEFQTENSEEVIKRVIESTSNQGDLVMDFFLGSGTTTAVAHKLKRKWIGVEMGEHFWNVVLPRMKQVLYYDKSGISKEKDVKEKYNEKTAGGFFKYQILEQYEDTLDNIELKENQQAQELFKDEYLLKYFLDFETKESPYLLNIEHLKNPFSYKLKVNLQEVGEPEEVVVDIPETFNYLLGLKVKKLKTRNNDRKYLFILGEKEGKDIAIVWREYYEKWKDEDFKKDKELIIEEIKDWNPQIVYVNGQSILTPKLGGDVDKAEIKFIEPEFKKLMGR
ncbi:MAG: site-specific DNA-methyltransferase [candidate division WOR-3 bacterium]